MFFNEEENKWKISFSYAESGPLFLMRTGNDNNPLWVASIHTPREKSSIVIFLYCVVVRKTLPCLFLRRKKHDNEDHLSMRCMQKNRHWERQDK